MFFLQITIFKLLSRDIRKPDPDPVKNTGSETLGTEIGNCSAAPLICHLSCSSNKVYDKSAIKTWGCGGIR